MAVTPHARALADLADEVEVAAAFSSPNPRLDLVTRAAGAGKHVLLEKPLEVATDRAERLFAAA